jgi:hypothetical protein
MNPLNSFWRSQRPRGNRFGGVNIRIFSFFGEYKVIYQGPRWSWLMKKNRGSKISCSCPFINIGYHEEVLHNKNWNMKSLKKLIFKKKHIGFHNGWHTSIEGRNWQKYKGVVRYFKYLEKVQKHLTDIKANRWGCWR